MDVVPVAICCKKCGAVVGFSYGAFFEIAGVKIMNRVKFRCRVCQWEGHWTPQKIKRLVEAQPTAK